MLFGPRHMMTCVQASPSKNMQRENANMHTQRLQLVFICMHTYIYTHAYMCSHCPRDIQHRLHSNADIMKG